jgi:EmrB/QacA subfamily drug resistance transporter
MTFFSRQFLVPLMVACALFMENLDSTVINTALPDIAHSLAESPLRLNLGITSYLFSLAVFIPVSGWVADRLGSRLVFMAAIVVFTLGSISCGFSQSLLDFVLARSFQGLGGAMMVPVGRLVVVRSVPKSDLVDAMTYISIPALIGPIIGPPLGGFITTYFSWRWIFWINVPMGILGAILAYLFLENIKEKDTPPFDTPGFLLVAMGCIGVTFGFELIGRAALPTSAIVALLAAGMAAISIYVPHARRVAHPILDLSLLKLPTFRACIIGGALARIGLGAAPFLLPLMFQVGFGLDAFHSGLLTFASAAGAFAMKFTARPILRRFGFRPVLIWSALVSAVFLAGYGLFTRGTSVLFILSVLLLGGFFRSLQYTSLNSMTYAEVPNARMSQATSFASMVQQLSMSVGVGFAALMLHLAAESHPRASILVADFVPVFLVVGLLSALPAMVFRMLPPDAGEELRAPAFREGPAAAKELSRG